MHPGWVKTKRALFLAGHWKLFQIGSKFWLSLILKSNYMTHQVYEDTFIDLIILQKWNSLPESVSSMSNYKRNVKDCLGSKVWQNQLLPSVIFRKWRDLWTGTSGLESTRDCSCRSVDHGTLIPWSMDETGIEIQFLNSPSPPTQPLWLCPEYSDESLSLSRVPTRNQPFRGNVLNSAEKWQSSPTNSESASFGNDSTQE